MLPSENRLKGQKSYDKVKEQGKVHQSKNLGVGYLKRSDNEDSKFGFVVSNKISKLAVSRNRIKRACREAVRQNLSYLPKGYDVVFLAKKTISSLTTDEIMKEVAVCIKWISGNEKNNTHSN